jgi:hypothetical protein
VVPSASMVNAAGRSAAVTACSEIASAPVAEYRILSIPEPPSLSWALRLIVTFLLVGVPEMYSAPLPVVALAVVVGAMQSFV